MLRTKSLISEITEVPRTWVFTFYLKLDVELNGQDVRINSVFNSADKTPSMYIFFAKDKNSYRFKDFSTGKGGDGVTLVHIMFNLKTRGEAAQKIMSDYNQYLLINKEDKGIKEFKIYQKYKVVEHIVRLWTNLDSKYWTKYHIGSQLLDFFYVKPLSSYKMSKEVDGEVRELLITGNYIYGYFRLDGTLYKIYQPHVKDNKFIKVRDYIQGTDQLTMNVPYLVIASSLKDIMAFKKLNYSNAESIAPDSENNLIPLQIISSYKHKYKGICILFDNDQPGIEAMAKYKEKYSLNPVELKLSKDLSDSLRDHGIRKVKEVLTPLLKQALNVQS